MSTGNNIVVSKSSTSSSSGGGYTLAQLTALFLTRASLSNYIGNVNIVGSLSSTSLSTTSITNTGTTLITLPTNTASAFKITNANGSITYMSVSTDINSITLYNTFTSAAEIDSLLLGFPGGATGILRFCHQFHSNNIFMYISPSLSTSYTLTLPVALPANNGTALVSDTSGNLSFDIPGIVVTGTLTQATIVNLGTTYAQIIGAPGAGLVNRVISFDYHYHYDGSNAYTLTGNMFLTYATSSGGSHLAGNNTFGSGLITATVDCYAGILGAYGSTGVGVNGASPLNQPIYFGASAAIGGSGTGTISYRLRYIVESMPF